jgi:hypothetical protein
MKLKPFVKPVVTEHILDYLIDWNTRFWDGLSDRAIQSAVKKAPPLPQLPDNHGLKILLRQQADVNQSIRELEALLKAGKERVATMKAKNESIGDSAKIFMKRLINLLKQNKGQQVVSKLKSMRNAPKDLTKAVEKLNDKAEAMHSTIMSYKDK